MSSIEDENNKTSKTILSDLKKNQFSTFNTYINELVKKLYSTIAIELMKITQNDIGSNIKAVLSANQIKDALQNEISGLTDKYTSEANTIKNNCLNEITQHIVLMNNYCELKLNNSLDESKGILNALANSIEKLIKLTQDNMKGVLFGFKSLSTYTSSISDYIKKQKLSTALEKIELSERMLNELSNKIKEIKEAHVFFNQETKGIFKQLKDILAEKSKSGKSKSPLPNTQGKTIEAAKQSPSVSSSSSYMNYKHNDKRSFNRNTLLSHSKENNLSSDHKVSSSDNKVQKTLSSNKLFNNSSSSHFHTSKSPIPKFDHKSLNDSIHQLKQKINESNKTNTDLKSILTKEKTEKAFLFKEITKLNAEIDKYKDYGISVNNAVSDIIKGNQIQKMFTVKEFNSQMMKISKISEMTIGFANSLGVLQDSIIKKSSTRIELKRLYDNLKRALVQIVSDLSAISKYITHQSGLNGQGYHDNNPNNVNNITDNTRSKLEEIEELQNEIFELKTQITLLNSQHIEKVARMQKEINETQEDPSFIFKQQNTFPISSKNNEQKQINMITDNNEIKQLKAELNLKSTSESLLIKEINELKEKEANESNKTKVSQSNNQKPNLIEEKQHNSNNQNVFDTIKNKHNQNLLQLKTVYQESIEAKEKSINNLNDTNSQLKSQLEKTTTEKNALEVTLSSNLIQYEIDLSNIQNEKMKTEILLEEARSSLLSKENKLIELTEALNTREKTKGKQETSLYLNKKAKEDDDTSNQRIFDDYRKLSQKIIELTSVIESKDLIEQSITENYNCLKKKISLFESKESQIEQKSQELSEMYLKEREKNDSLVIDKMLLMQKNDDLNHQIQDYSKGNDYSYLNLINQTPKIYHICTKSPISFISNHVRNYDNLTISKIDEIAIRSITSIEKSNWKQLKVLTNSVQIEYNRDEAFDNNARADKQLINKQKEELSLVKNKLRTSLEENDLLTQKLEEIESNFNSEKGEYVGMLRVAFEKLISEIQITSKSKEFTTVIMRMLNYSDDDIFDIYNSGNKKTFFGFLK